MKLIKFIALLFICSLSFSQSKDYDRGKIIDSISVKRAANESFQLYLPNAYNSEKNSAIIFIYDPDARGTNGIKPFIEAADKFNYILIC